MSESMPTRKGLLEGRQICACVVAAMRAVSVLRRSAHQMSAIAAMQRSGIGAVVIKPTLVRMPRTSQTDPVADSDARTVGVGSPSLPRVEGNTTFAEILQCSYSSPMSTTLTISNRGVISLPAALRKAIGLKPNDQLIAEATAEGILLRPAVTVPLEIYTDVRIAEFDVAEADLAAVLAKRAATRSKVNAGQKKRNASRKA